MKHWAALLVLLLAPWWVQAEPLPPQPGIYSNLTYFEEGDDLVGIELTIVPRWDHQEIAYSAFVQIAEGGLLPYFTLVPITLNGNQVSFTVPAHNSQPGTEFSGVWEGSTLTLKWPTGTEARLKRGKSYWNEE